MITERSMRNAKRHCDGLIPEQCPYFMEAMRSPIQWIFKNGKWRPRRTGWKLSEETRKKQSEAKRRKNENN